MIHSIHSSHISQQCLCCTNIGSGFFSFDMLFPCLQCHSQSPVALRINTDTDDTAGYAAFEFIFGRKESRMGSAVS